MRRYAILLGNTNGLPGVQKDLIGLKAFLHSERGGCWNENEIFLKENISLENLRTLLNNLKRNNYDYLIFYFSGHGGYNKRNTIIKLNKNNETVSESELKNVAKRQLTIFDCCRCLIKPTENFSSEALLLEKSFCKNIIRGLFDNRILQASPQQTTLYSCDVGQYSNDTNRGGIYTVSLLKAIDDSNSTFTTVLDAHLKAEKATSKQTNNDQKPCYEMAKLPPEKQLIIALNPNHRWS